MYGVKATIVMPTTTPLIKVERTKALRRRRGAGTATSTTRPTTTRSKLAEENGYTFIHPFNDLAVATGQGTIAMEIVQELPLVDYILVPIGGGGLATGVSTLAKLLNPNIKVIGVEPAGAACMKAALEAGHVVKLPQRQHHRRRHRGARAAATRSSPTSRRTSTSIITVEDDELIVAFLDMVENHKMIVENSGLLTVAALNHLDCQGQEAWSPSSRGGNMDVITMSSVVQHGLIQRDRIFTVSVLLPDRPGELVTRGADHRRQQGQRHPAWSTTSSSPRTATPRWSCASPSRPSAPTTSSRSSRRSKARASAPSSSTRICKAVPGEGMKLPHKLLALQPHTQVAQRAGP